MGQPTLAVAIPTVTASLSARTGVFGGAAAATTTKLMDQHSRGRPLPCIFLTSAGRLIDEADRGDPDRRASRSLSGSGGLSILRLKQEKRNEP
jgi:hypothetical protein